MTQQKHSLWDLFSMRQNGKLKSTFLMYSFALSFLFLAVYGACFFCLAEPIERLFRESSLMVRAVMESLLPVIPATLLCLLCQRIARDKRIAAAAFGWLLLYALVAWVLMRSVLEGEEYRMFLSLFLSVAPGPLLIGGGATVLVMLRAEKRSRV